MKKTNALNTFLLLISLASLITVIIFYLKHVAHASHYFANTDFYTFYQTMRLYFDGQNIYGAILAGPQAKFHLVPSADLNPPFFTLLLTPLFYLNYGNALLLWVSISLALSLASIYLILNAFPEFKLEHWQKIAIIALFMLYGANIETFSFGQITAFIEILTVFAWLATRQQREITAGILLGFLANIKLFYGLFFIQFLVQKRFRLISAMTITGIICLLLGWLFFGTSAYLSYFQGMHKITWYAATWNISFLGFFSRFFGIGEKNLVLLNVPHLAQALAGICSLTLFIFLCRTWHKLAKQRDVDLGFSLTLVSMLLISPLGWTYYFSILIIAYCCMIAASKKTTYPDVFHVLGCCAIFLSPLAGGLLKAAKIKTIKDILYFGSVDFAAILLLLIALFYLSTNIRKEHLLIKDKASTLKQLLLVLIYALAFIPSLTYFYWAIY